METRGQEDSESEMQKKRNQQHLQDASLLNCFASKQSEGALCCD